jgi:hypothetical protein
LGEQVLHSRDGIDAKVFNAGGGLAAVQAVRHRAHVEYVGDFDSVERAIL